LPQKRLYLHHAAGVQINGMDMPAGTESAPVQPDP
jgi:hypothetical protein